MERNSENRNRYGNDRNRRQSDQYDDRNESFNYRQDREQNWERDKGQWDVGPRDERGSRQTNYRPYSGIGDNRRLESMGSLGNDWANRKDANDYGRDRNYGGRDSGSYGDRYRSFDYGNSGTSMGQERDRDRSGSFRPGDKSRDWWDKTKDEVSGWFGDENAQQRRDWDRQGEHRGKGPKGYVRTDERIKEDVNERLTDDGLVDASEIEVDVRNGEVFLKGTVNSRQEKRRAEDVIENISGVKNVENHIKVQQGGYRSGNIGQYDDKRYGTEHNKNN